MKEKSTLPKIFVVIFLFSPISILESLFSFEFFLPRGLACEGSDRKLVSQLMSEDYLDHLGHKILNCLIDVLELVLMMNPLLYM